MRMTVGGLCVLLIVPVLAARAAGGETAPPVAGIEIGPEVFGDLRARNIGPAVMSGRISALDVVDGDPRILYVGAASGGVWKSRNSGVTFKPVFDDHNQCIGAIAIDQARPDTVWVGTGEGWVRNSVSLGDGVYRTVDGGQKWARLGLEGTERIAEIIIHPADPATVYVAALGPLWEAAEDRGLFRTGDGGASWQKILYVDPNTGCCDIEMDPEDPRILYAAMWEFRRSPDFFKSGGPGSGLYKSTDGGATWRKLETGLPPGELGRIALAVSPARPDRVYAAVEAASSAIYRSDDRGETWSKVNTQEAVKGRPFYFQLLVPDPQDADRVYRTSTELLVTRDGGRNFGGVGGWVHSDYHTLWIDPGDPAHMIAGTDGGVYITHNRGDGWRHVTNLPVSQFYRVAVDDRRPFRVYGGLQDNGSWFAPSRAPGGIENGDWENLGGGDGFGVWVDRGDPEFVYWEWQGGNLNRKDLRTGESKSIKPLPAAGEPDYRFNWDTPVTGSPTDPQRLYVGSQFLHRSRDRGESWQRISPDLTTDDPARQRQDQSGGLTIDNTTAENHCTVTTIGESPRDKKVIWAGTDDGKVQVTENDGKQWRQVQAQVPDLPEGTWISCVCPSPHDRATVFLTADGHRSGDGALYVFVTKDLGRSWRSLAGSGVTGFAHVIRQDPVNPDLLFLGTEDGLFITLDGGLHWARFQEEFPPVPVMDLVIQEREAALVIATHGRGIYILDDLAPLRKITGPMLAAEVALLPARPAVLDTPRWKQQFPGDTHFAADNPGSSARILYFLKKRHMFGEMKLEIFTPAGELLTTLPGGKRKGLNVVTWSPRLKPPKVAPSPTLDPSIAFAGAVGPAAPEGTYTYRLTKGEEVFTGDVAVTYAPDFPHTPQDRDIQQRTVQELYGMLARLAYVAEAVTAARDTSQARAAALPAEDPLGARLLTFAAELDTLHSELVATRKVQGISGQKRLRENVVGLYGGIAGFGGRPTRSQLERMAVYRGRIEEADARFAGLTAGRLAELNAALVVAGRPPIPLLSEEDFRSRGE